jgi:hypothetical protein
MQQDAVNRGLCRIDNPMSRVCVGTFRLEIDIALNSLEETPEGRDAMWLRASSTLITDAVKQQTYSGQIVAPSICIRKARPVQMML